METSILKNNNELTHEKSTKTIYSFLIFKILISLLEKKQVE